MDLVQKANPLTPRRGQEFAVLRQEPMSREKRQLGSHFERHHSKLLQFVSALVNSLTAP
jgi:hypothetical protein